MRKSITLIVAGLLLLGGLKITFMVGKNLFFSAKKTEIIRDNPFQPPPEYYKTGSS